MCKLQLTLQKIEDDGGDSMINRQCQDTIEQDDVLKKDDFDKLFIINPLLHSLLVWRDSQAVETSWSGSIVAEKSENYGLI